MAKDARLRPGRADDLGVRRALADRLLPFLVAAMAFLAALALAGAIAAESLAQQWHGDGAAVLTVQVPDPGQPAEASSRIARVAALLRADPAVAKARVLSADELRNLLRPWLGTEGLGTGRDEIALPLPAVLDVRLAPAATFPDDGQAVLTTLTSKLELAAPGTLVDSHGPWLRRLGILARSLQAVAALATAVVVGIAIAVVAVATRAGLSARRDAIGIVHGLGATDGYIAGRFARRATALAGAGAVLGAIAAVPLLAGLARLAAPFTGGPQAAPSGALPASLWLGLVALPFAAAAIGWLTAQVTVRGWLRRLP